MSLGQCVTFAISATIFVSVNASAQHIAPSALLTIDQNRSTVVERIVDEWGDRLATSNAGITSEQLREILSGLRADHLLAASLAGSVAGLRDVVSGALVRTDAAVSPARMHTKALGDTGDDLVYTPVVPCRILDTRNGTIAPYNSVMVGGAAFPVAANLSNFAPQGGSATNCNLPSTFQAIAVTLTVLNPNFDAFLAASSSSDFPTLTRAVVMDFSANKGLANTTIVPVDGSVKFYLGLPAQVTTHVIADVAGYFKRAVNSSTGAFEVAINGSLALTIQPDATSPIFIAGSNANTVTAGASGAAIGGGGATGTVALGLNCSNPPGGPCANRVTDAFGTIGGGLANQAGDGAGTNGDNPFATVGGGIANSASRSGSTIAGGFQNTASAVSTTIGGGFANKASALYGTVAGGSSNTSSGLYSAVGAGQGNTSSAQATTVGGGQSNQALINFATVAGGYGNIATGLGEGNTVGGGENNTASGDESTVAGGFKNTASGDFSTVPGGGFNTALGSYSFAAGFHANANYDGCFVWGDASTSNEVRCDEQNRFVVRATHGIFMFTGGSTQATYTGAVLPPGATAWIAGSDRANKDNLRPVDAKAVLRKVASMPIATWNWKSQDASIRHMGPMAQDFHAAFGLGETPKGISTVDADGVALAAIQGLHQLIKQKDRKISAMERELAAIKEKLNMR
jgi:hypothetical protein